MDSGIERTIEPNGQHLPSPDYAVDVFLTTLGSEQASAADVVALYKNHGTHEPFRS